MEQFDNILGCYLRYPTLYSDASEAQKANAKHEGDLFRNYLWGENGFSHNLKKLKHVDYGNDLRLILFEFYVKPIEFDLENFKVIQNYRWKEKSIGISIIVTDENFFNKSEIGRWDFFKKSVFENLGILEERLKKKKLDTKLEQLISDLKIIL